MLVVFDYTVGEPWRQPREFIQSGRWLPCRL